ncbi:MAG TPA: tetratricopeptide repeat protein [Candidatus Atribacteria bacterium]|nr:tetratricopeptide repeat protein [Candidatus Atribacteria bacterium]
MIQIINTNSILKSTILLIPLFINRNVHEFRVNQEMLLKFLLIIALALWAIETLNKKKFIWKKNSLNLPFLLLIGLMTISLVRSEYFAVSFKEYVIFLSYFVLFFLVINNIKQKQQFDIFIQLFFFTSFVVAFFALLHYYGLDPYLKDIPQLISTIGQKNWASNYLAMIFPIVFSYFLVEKNNRKIIYYLLLSLLYTILIIFQSRGIWISAGLTLILGIFLLYKFRLANLLKENKRWLFLLFITFALITVFYSIRNPLNKNTTTIPQKITSVYEDNFSSLDSRLLMWNTAFEMIKDKPFLGIGIGLFKMDYLDYQAGFLKENPNYLKYHSRAEEAHNEYLQLTAELGIIGLGIFLYILFIFYRLALKYLNEKRAGEGKKEKLILWGMLMGLTCFLFDSMFTFPLHVPALGSAFFIIFALTFLYINNFFTLEQQDQVKIEKDEEKKKEKGRREKSKNKQSKSRKNKKFEVVYIYIVLVLFLMIVAINFLVIKPYVADIAYFKGIKYYNRQDYQRALPNFERAGKLDPYNGKILYALGTNYYNLNDYSKAEDVLERAENYVRDKYLFRNLGLCYIKLGDYKKAEEELGYAVYLDSEFISAYLDLANLYSNQQNYDQAIANWLKVLEINPGYSERYKILYNLGLMYQRKKMSHKALFYFKQALDSAPEGNPLIENITKEIKRLESE